MVPLKWMSLLFKESVKQRSSKWEPGSLTNHRLCPMGISGREWGKGPTHHRNLKMTTSLFGERGWNAFYTLSLTSLHNARQGSVVLRQGKAVPLLCVYKSKWPNLLYPSLRLALFSISRCSSFFFRAPPSGKKWLRTPPSHFLFSRAFSLHKAAVNVFCVWWGGNDTFHGGPHHCLHWWLKWPQD